MVIVLQPPVPAERSIVWQVHDGYFRQRGIRAWTAGEVPWYATSNLPTAKAHAAFLLSVAPAEGPVAVLEVGCGHGEFAARFVSALRRHLGDAGRALLSRLTYFLTDFSERTLREAIATPPVAAGIDAGVLHPLVYDVRDPLRATDLDGREVVLPPLSLVLGNYVACVLPSKELQWRGPGGWFEQWLSVKADVADDASARPIDELRAEVLKDPTRARLVQKDLSLDVSWARTNLTDTVADPVHREALAALVAGRGDLTVSFPTGFATFAARVAATLAPWGYVLCNDYGSTALEDLDGLDDRLPQVYGNSLAHGVAFPALEAWARAAGWDVVRTRDPFESVHSAALRPAPWSDADRATFARLAESDESDEIVDASSVAKRFVDDRQHERALRFFRRCLELEPDNVEHLFRAGSAAVDCGRLELAVELLQRGYELQRDAQDWEFQLGRAWCLLEGWDTSRDWYEKAILRDRHPVALANLAVVYEELGRFAEAVDLYEEAARLDPEDPRPSQCLAALRDRFWQQRLAELRKR